MAKVTDPSFKFWFDEKYYTVQGAETMARLGTKDDLSTMRSEYTRMRDVAQKRLKRLAKEFPGSKVVENHPHGFKKLKDIDPRDFPKAFSELAKFVRAKRSTVTGQKQIRDKTIQTWQNQGLNLNQKNYNMTIRVLEEMRNRKIVYGSDKAVELADTMMELQNEQLEQWFMHLDTLLQHTDELDDLKEIPGYDFDEVIELLGW